MNRKVNLPSKRKSLSIDGIDYYSIGKETFLKQGTIVITPDGSGKTIGINKRKNTNRGPGTRQYIVQLDDGRIRHYAINEVFEIK